MTTSQANCRNLADELLLEWEAEQMRRGYRFLPASFLKSISSYEQAKGASARAELLRDILLNLLDRFDEVQQRPLRLKLVSSAAHQLSLEHERIRREYRHLSDPELTHVSNDIFLKDLGVAALKLVPTGPTLVDINQGIPRSTVLRAMRRSLGHGLSTASFLLFGHRGFKPALEMHMSLKRRDEFTPEGRQRSFRGIAELIEANPTYLGAFGTSWYYDPALASVSPRLAYVRDEPARHGARFAYVGVDDNITRSALGKSATRSALFAEGKYRPCAYMLIWPKRDLIAYQLADR